MYLKLACLTLFCTTHITHSSAIVKKDAFAPSKQLSLAITAHDYPTIDSIITNNPAIVTNHHVELTKNLINQLKGDNKLIKAPIVFSGCYAMLSGINALWDTTETSFVDKYAELIISLSVFSVSCKVDCLQKKQIKQLQTLEQKLEEIMS